MFQNQTFHLADFRQVALLVVLEALLSADNALVLAIIVKKLPIDQRKKALFYGLAGAFVFRLIVIMIASQLLNFWWLQAIGGLYLIFLAIKHWLVQQANDSGPDVKPAKVAGFWPTVLQAELTDIAFAIDSVLVAVAVEPHPNKLWVVYVGAMLGVVTLRWAAGLVLRLLEKYPTIEHVAYALVAWAGVKLSMLAGHTLEKWMETRGSSLPIHIPEMTPAVFWTGLLIIIGVGGFIALRKGPENVEPITPSEEEEIEMVEEGIEDAKDLVPDSENKSEL